MMGRKVHGASGVAWAWGVALAATVLAAPASAQPSGSVEYSFGLGARQPDAPSGMNIRVFYGEAEAKPPQLEEVVLDLPEGLRLDTEATPRCDATDEDLRVRGRDACPAGSRIGAGEVTAVTGIQALDPIVLDATVFNGGDQLIELVTFRGSEQTAGYDRLHVDGTRLVAHPPNTPGGPPDGRTTIREISLAIDERVADVEGRRRSLITTPPSCPAAGTWTSRATITFAEYASPTSVVAATPCVAEAARPPRMTLRVTPRRVRRGTRTRFRLRVSSPAPRCRGRVAVRLGGTRRITNSRGRATVAATFARSGRKTVRAAKPGCAVARARVRVRP